MISSELTIMGDAMQMHDSGKVRAIADDPGVVLGDHVWADGRAAEVIQLAHTGMGSWACRVRFDDPPVGRPREAWMTPWHLRAQA